MGTVFPAVKALIEKDNKYLLITHRINGKVIWDLPGGRIKYGETPYQALEREMQEELTLRVNILKHLGVYWFYREKDMDEVICNLFLCKIREGEIDLMKNPSETETIEEIKWVTLDELKNQGYSNDSLPTLLSEL